MYFTILVFPNCVLVGRVDILVRKYYFGGNIFNTLVHYVFPHNASLVSHFLNGHWGGGKGKKGLKFKGTSP